MPRRMSCSMTIEQVRSRTKTVTRRATSTWQSLEPGDSLVLIEKGMGLPKGAKQVELATVEIVSVTVEPLDAIDYVDCVREGFPHMNPDEFKAFWLKGHGHASDATGVTCRRIEWRYL